MLDPLIILLAGVLTVLGMITVLRVNALLSLLSAAFVVSFLTPLEPGQAWNVNVQNVSDAFGKTAGSIGVLIVMGAVIGKCMLDSGSADRIIRFLMSLFGERLISVALISSGYILSIPVFYDTTFYLLVPIARSVYKTIRKNYILYLTAIGFGATLSHTLIPPTPGPLLVAGELKIPLGNVMLVSLLVGTCTVPFALGIAFLVNRILPNPEIHFEDEQRENPAPPVPGGTLPSLFAAFIPILLPVFLIAVQTTVEMLEKGKILVWSDSTLILRNAINLFGNAQVALILAAVAAMTVLYRHCKLSLRKLEQHIEPAIISAGMIVLITAAGGAFGKMLQQAKIGERIQDLFKSEQGLTGIVLLLLAFGVAAMLKTAQGSSTTAMITTAGIFSGILFAENAPELPYNTAYVAVCVGLGSCVTGWMNDSGFWLFCRMGGVKETDALKTWTFGLVLLGCSGLVIALIFSQILPLTSLPE
ncbi:MAG: GntP family permease [Planctomycetaceae bacterium]|jgi:GntP family gluconate:H+ symporter|nr:GntP family permease [Planctomycetaceae bacterium]